MDLTLCSDVCYEKRKGEHVVHYRTEGDGEGWSPVRQKWRRSKSRDGSIDI